MSVRRSLAWSYGAQAFIFAQTFIVAVIVARILGPYEMGIFAVGSSTAAAISVISWFGVGSYLVRHESPDATLKATAFTVNAILNILVSCALLAVVFVGMRFGMITQVREVLLLLAVTPLLGVFELLPATFMQREMNFKLISLISMCRATLSSAVLLSLALSGLGYLSPAIAAVASTVFTVIAYNVLARSHVSLKVGLVGWRDMTKFGMQMMSIGGLSALTQRMSELILARFLGIAALGIYTRASSMGTQIWENVYGQSIRVIFTQMAKEKRETGSLRHTYINGLALISAIFAPLFAGIAVLSQPLVYALYGDKWIGAAAPLSFLMVGYIVYLCISMNWELCVLSHRTAWQARNEGIRAAVGLVAFTVGASFNVTAAAFGRVVEGVCGFLLFGPQMRAMAGTERGEISKVYRQSAALTVAAVGPVLLSMIWTGWSPHASWLVLLPLIGIGVALWFWLLRRFQHPLLTEMKRAVQRLKRRGGPATAQSA